MGTLAEAFARLLEVLDRMEIPYAVGGSVASSAHGIPRTTLDVDIVVDLKPDQIDGFAAELHKDFYADAALIREAFARGRAANLIHLRTAWKFDLFPLRNDESAGQSSPGAPFGRSVRMAERQSSVLWRRRRIRSCANLSGIAPRVRLRNVNGTICAVCARLRTGGSTWSTFASELPG